MKTITNPNTDSQIVGSRKGSSGWTLLRGGTGSKLLVLFSTVLVLTCCYQCRSWIIPKRFGVVEPGQIFRSGQISRFLIQPTLEKYHIRSIVDLSGLSEEHPDQRRERECSQELGVQHHCLPLRGDGTGDIESYASAIELIHHARQLNEPVLVHCAAGSQRTGGVVAAYRLLVQGVPEDRVIREMEAYDWNPEKDQVLPQYLDAHWVDLVNSLIRRGVLTAPPAKYPVLSTRK